MCEPPLNTRRAWRAHGWHGDVVLPAGEALASVGPAIRTGEQGRDSSASRHGIGRAEDMGGRTRQNKAHLLLAEDIGKVNHDQQHNDSKHCEHTDGRDSHHLRGPR